MLESILMSLGGLIALAIGGELLVRGSVGIAQKLGVSTLVTGLVIVGFATSMPEMVASVQAAIAGSPQMAWGNVVGSNLANTLLILGATALVMPIGLSGAGKGDAAVALAVTLVIWGIAATQWGTPMIGAALLVSILVYIYWRYNLPHDETMEEDVEGDPMGLGLAITLFLIGLALLVVGGNFLVTGAIDLARIFGVSETVIGLTVIAVGTSLPELAASIAAAMKGRSGLAIGNVVGSNIYNILLIGGTTMTIAPIPIPAELLTYELAILAGSAVLLLLILAYVKQIGRLLGALLLGAFALNTLLTLG